MKTIPYPQEIKEKARLMWMACEPVTAIIKQLGINNVRVVYQWRDKYNWDGRKIPETALLAATRRFNLLLEIEDKSSQDWQEIERLQVIITKFEDAELSRRLKEELTYTRSETKGEVKKRKTKKNQVDDLTQEDFDRVANEILYPHQRIIYDAGKNPKTRRSRIILKPRQVGGTFGLAFEAFESACMTGQNQIFLSATVAQAEVFKSYIAIIALKYFNVEIAGNPTILSNKAEVCYLSPQAFSAQSRSGNYYLDEFFWLRGDFKEFFEVSSKMATQTKYKRTLISTPSAISHPAYPYWSGDWYNKNRPEAERIEINVDKSLLKNGRLDGDGFWRYAFTIHDVLEWGFDDRETGEPMISLEEIRRETDPALFPCLFEAEFIDDTGSVFKLNDILSCAVDIAQWKDFDRLADRPFGNKPVCVGYDVAGVGDNASAVVISRPKDRTEKFRKLQKNNWRGINAPAQCGRMQYIINQFNVEILAADTTGAGYYVSEFMTDFFPQIDKVQFSPEIKTMIVQKFQSVLADNRFEYDEDDKNFPLACMTVYQTVTPKSNQITYASHRTKATGHADEFWATGLAIMKAEPLNPDTRRNFSISSYH